MTAMAPVAPVLYLGQDLRLCLIWTRGTELRREIPSPNASL